NAVRHAHKGESALLIDIEIAVYAKWLEIRIWDSGPPFNLHEKLREKLLKELLERKTFDELDLNFDELDLKEGGWGIKLMWKIADLLRYTRTSDDRNCLLILALFSLED
ncbi:MAG TPA: ATP-binding protein, partial [Thermosynechococcaceae cyanobacterium]